jgi:hypothetical protein
MWVEANMSIGDKMGVEVDKVVTLHRISEFEHSYTVGMDVEVSDLKPHLNCNVVIDFMEELVLLSWGEVACPLHYCNGAIFMTFGETPPPDVHLLSFSSMRTPSSMNIAGGMKGVGLTAKFAMTGKLLDEG